MSLFKLLQELEKLFPDKLPDQRDYSPDKVLIQIGQQQVIRFIKRLHEDERKT